MGRTAVAAVAETNDWDEFLKSVSEGMDLEAAMLEHRISPKVLDATVRNPLQAERWQDARIAALGRSWSVFDRDAVFERIAVGMKVTDAITSVRGKEDPGFYELIVADVDMKTRFERAMEIRTLRNQQLLIDEASDRSRDVLQGPKGEIPNMAAVQRSRLIVDVQRDLMGVWSSRFAPGKSQVAVQVNVNHVEVLENARERARKGRVLVEVEPKGGKSREDVIEANFIAEEPVPAAAERAEADTARRHAELSEAVRREDPDKLRAKAAEQLGAAEPPSADKLRADAAESVDVEEADEKLWLDE